MSNRDYRWKAMSAATADEDNGRASSITDIFADMLTVNEDLIVAVAESQADGNIEGLIAHQRVLHRDLIEMAEFIDSVFGVYSSKHSLSTAKSDQSGLPVVVNLTAKTKCDEPVAERTVKADTKFAEKNVHCGALIAAFEAEEQVFENQRSKEQWIKSRHQVLEEEEANAVMNDSGSGILEIGTATAGETNIKQGNRGIALANQLRAHKHVAAFLKASNESAKAHGPMPPTNVMFSSQYAVPAATPCLSIPAPISHVSPVMTLSMRTDQQFIRPAAVKNNTSKIALPSTHSMPNMVLAFPGLMCTPHTVGRLIPMPQWQAHLQTPLPARSVLAARPTAKSHPFKRMCELCRKRHLSYRHCRIVLQHTEAEWQPAQPPSSGRRRRRKQFASNTVTSKSNKSM